MILLLILVSLGFNSLWLGLWMTLGLIFGIKYFAPDLDIKSSLYYRWGFMRWIWYPYQKMFKHRSVFTHGFIISDVIRIIYFGLLATLIMLPTGMITLSFFGQTFLPFINEFKFEIMFFFLGILIASITHTATDYISSAMK